MIYQYIILISTIGLSFSTPVPRDNPYLRDWIEPYDAANLLFAVNLSNDTRLVPSIGNGYLATVFESDTLFISGVYNGNATEDRPSHRARIPGITSVVWQHPREIIMGIALDLQNAAVIKRSMIDGVMVEKKTMHIEL